MFENRIPYAIKQDILDFFEKQQINLKKELRYSLTTASTIPMNMSPASSTTGTSRAGYKVQRAYQAVAVAICDNWRQKSTEIYDILVKQLWASNTSS
ncbi:MAG: DUF4364 family protein [Coprococcus sp.]